jgi:hypothetical protein
MAGQEHHDSAHDREIQRVSLNTEISGANGVFARVSYLPSPAGQHVVCSPSSAIYQGFRGAVFRPGGLDCGGGSIYGTMML